MTSESHAVHKISALIKRTTKKQKKIDYYKGEK